jgi:hypothetical protein
MAFDARRYLDAPSRQAEARPEWQNEVDGVKELLSQRGSGSLSSTRAFVLSAVVSPPTAVATTAFFCGFGAAPAFPTPPGRSTCRSCFQITAQIVQEGARLPAWCSKPTCYRGASLTDPITTFSAAPNEGPPL